MPLAELGGRTNPVEAHLFVGLVPLLCGAAWTAIAVKRRDRLSLVWAGLGLAALVYTTGWLVPIGQHLPGFKDLPPPPDATGLITTLAAAVLAGKGLDWLRQTNSPALQAGVLVAFVGAMFTGLMLTGEAESVSQLNGRPSPFTLGEFRLSDGPISALLLLGVLSAFVAWLGRFLAGFDAAVSGDLRTLDLHGVPRVRRRRSSSGSSAASWRIATSSNRRRSASGCEPRA